MCSFYSTTYHHLKTTSFRIFNFQFHIFLDEFQQSNKSLNLCNCFSFFLRNFCRKKKVFHSHWLKKKTVRQWCLLAHTTSSSPLCVRIIRNCIFSFWAATVNICWVEGGWRQMRHLRSSSLVTHWRTLELEPLPAWDIEGRKKQLRIFGLIINSKKFTWITRIKSKKFTWITQIKSKKFTWMI